MEIFQAGFINPLTYSNPGYRVSLGIDEYVTTYPPSGILKSGFEDSGYIKYFIFLNFRNALKNFL